jgi:hypothetical protein
MRPPRALVKCFGNTNLELRSGGITPSALVEARRAVIAPVRAPPGRRPCSVLEESVIAANRWRQRGVGQRRQAGLADVDDPGRIQHTRTRR